MKHLLAAIVASAFASALPVLPAAAQQSDAAPSVPAAPPVLATATTEQLAQIRTRMMALAEELRGMLQDSPRRKAVMEESEQLSERMRTFSAQLAPVTERLPIDAKLVEVSNRMSPDFGPEPMKGMTRRTFIHHFADTVSRDLFARGSRVDITVDLPIAMLTISGPQWEVEEAKAALRSALPDYLQRVLELEEIEVLTRATQRGGLEKEKWLQLERSTVNINWDGGTLAALVKAIRSTVECNVVLADATVGSLVIPALSVNRVAPEVFFQSLQSIPLADNRGLAVTVIAPEPKPAPASMDGKAPASIDTRPVIVIAEKLSVNPLAGPASVTQRIIDLSDWPGTEGAGMKRLIETIDFAMQANGTAEQMKVRFYEPSKLLFAKGPADSIRLIGEIVDAIRNQK